VNIDSWALTTPAASARGHEGNRRLADRWQVYHARTKRLVIANVAIARAVRPGPGDLPAPRQRHALHLLHAGELPASPDRVADVGHRPFDLRLERPRRIDDHCVVGGQLRIGACG